MTAALARLRSPSLMHAAATLAVVTVTVLATLVVTVRLSPSSYVHLVATAAAVAATAWMFMSRRYERTLLVLLLYLALADGFLKLKTNGGASVTLARDVLLYAIAAGALVRATIERRSLQTPPLTMWVIAFVAIVVVQLLNPSDGTLGHSLASLRPHIEFVPLFFLAYGVMRTKRRLRAFLVVLLAVSAVNGVVSLVQFNLTPDQLASWGPGYANRVYGNGVSQRIFFSANGTQDRTRPFALGSDSGFGGDLGLIAAPGALLLIGSAIRGWRKAAIVLMAAGVVLAIVTSQQRTAVVGSILALLTFGAMATLSRRTFAILLGGALAAVLTLLIILPLAGSSGSGAFRRYSSITPSKLVKTTYDYRGSTLALLPRYAKDFPFGTGIGTAGPASSVGGTKAPPALNAESEFNFLLIELGIPGVLCLLLLNLRLLGSALVHIRRFVDPELRLLLAAMVAPLVALLVTWFTDVSTATTPGSPYFWFVAGTLAYWLAPYLRGRRTYGRSSTA
jgi:hypothetical protein